MPDSRRNWDSALSDMLKLGQSPGVRRKILGYAHPWFWDSVGLRAHDVMVTTTIHLT